MSRVMRFVDTNIFLRFMLNDTEQANACESLFRKVVAGEETIFTTAMVMAEVVWVLASYYGLSRTEVREKMEKIVNTPGLICENSDVIIQALSIYEEKNIDYIDAYNACLLKEKGINELYSYDKHFDRLKGLKRLEPGI